MCRWVFFRFYDKVQFLSSKVIPILSDNLNKFQRNFRRNCAGFGIVSPHGLERYPNWDRKKIGRNFRIGLDFLPVLGLVSVPFVEDRPNFVRYSEQIPTQFQTKLRRIFFRP